MENINVFELVVHEKRSFKDLSKYPVFWPLYYNTTECPFSRYESYQIWLKSTKQFWRRSRLREKVDRRRTLRHPISSAGLRSGALKRADIYVIFKEATPCVLRDNIAVHWSH